MICRLCHGLGSIPLGQWAVQLDERGNVLHAGPLRSRCPDCKWGVLPRAVESRAIAAPVPPVCPTVWADWLDYGGES